MQTYSTGTVSVSAGGTTVTGVGTIWSGINARETDRISIDGSPDILITAVTDTGSLEITPWSGANKSGVPYIIYQNYPARVLGVAAAEDVGTVFAKLKTGGLPFLVEAPETEPDPSLGADGQYGHNPVTGAWWLKSGGVWTPTVSPYGLQPSLNLSDVANAAEARVNLSAASFPRSSNTALALADHDALVVATSTFTQTFTAAATLGSGWRIWYRNNGTGIITFDPNSSETIDGTTTLKIYPGEECLITCDGSAFYTSGLADRVVLETKVLSAAATADFLKFDNTRFSRYEFQFSNVYPSTNTAALWCRITNDGGRAI